MSEGGGASVEWVDDRRDVALVELVNRVLDRGVVVTGELVVSVAGVDLLLLDLRILLASPDRILGPRSGSTSGSTSGSSSDASSGASEEDEE